MVSNNFSAVDGRNSGAQILVVTKSGTNQLHGGASYYFENNTLADLPPEKAVLLLGTNDVKAVLFVKADRPYRIRPGSDQHRALRQFPQMRHLF